MFENNLLLMCVYSLSYKMQVIVLIVYLAVSD